MSVAPLAINSLPGQAAPEVVLRFTDAYRSHQDTAPALREAACLRAQFPAILMPWREGDVFAGRRAYAPVGFDADLSGGYFFNDEAFCGMLAGLDEADPRRAGLERAGAFWREENSAAKCRRMFPAAVREALPEDGHLKAKHAAYPLYRQAGTVGNFSRLVEHGLPGLTADVQARRAQGDSTFLKAAESALGVLGDCLAHYAAALHAGGRQGHAATLDALQWRAPATLFEALQLIWMFSLVSGVQNFGRLDVVLAPILAADRGQNGLSDDAALNSLCGFWRMADEELNLMNARIVIGGTGRPDDAAADEVARLMIEAARRTRVTRPQLSLRWWEGGSPELWDAALDCIAEGTTFPILYSDAVNIPGVARAFGVSEKEAAAYVPYGCGEYVLGSASLNPPNGIINLLKCLELALFNGIDPKSGERMGPATGDAAGFGDFEQLWRAYAAQVEFLVGPLAEAHRVQHEVCAGDFAMLLASLLLDDCLKRGRSALDGGVRHSGGLLESYGNTNTAEALAAIRQVIFEHKTATLTDLREAMRTDFSGSGPLRMAFLRAPKYGNNDPAADAMVLRVQEHLSNTCHRAGADAGLSYYLPVVINNWNNTVQGHACLASADGRLADDPLVSGNAPLPGADCKGPTALLLSLAKIPAGGHAGVVQNLKFDAAMFRKHRTKLKALLEVYLLGGGTQAMLTVVSMQDLLDALDHPERHPNLLVRIGGFSARFVSLPREVQLEVIRRTEHG